MEVGNVRDVDRIGKTPGQLNCRAKVRKIGDPHPVCMGVKSVKWVRIKMYTR